MRTNEVTTINIAGNRPYEDAVTIKEGIRSAQSVFSESPTVVKKSTNETIKDTTAKPVAEQPKESKLLKTAKTIGKVVKPVAKVLGPIGVGLTVADIAEAHENVIERNESGGRDRNYQRSYEEFRKRNPKTPYDHIKGLMMEAFQ